MTDEQALLESLEEEARAEREQLLDDARSEADAIRARAQREADRQVEEARLRGEKLGTVEVDRRVGLARQEVNLAVLGEKHRVLADTREDLAKGIDQLRKRPEYADALKRWTSEVIDRLREGATVHANPADVKTVKAIVSERGASFSVSGDAKIVGGVRAVSGDGKVVAENTLTSRLARAEERLAEVMGRALFGVEGDSTRS
jgi:V/A-type H+-transporting ATPase subunit E